MCSPQGKYRSVFILNFPVGVINPLGSWCCRGCVGHRCSAGSAAGRRAATASALQVRYILVPDGDDHCRGRVSRGLAGRRDVTGLAAALVCLRLLPPGCETTGGMIPPAACVAELRRAAGVAVALIMQMCTSAGPSPSLDSCQDKIFLLLILQGQCTEEETATVALARSAIAACLRAGWEPGHPQHGWGPPTSGVRPASRGAGRSSGLGSEAGGAGGAFSSRHHWGEAALLPLPGATGL